MALPVSTLHQGSVSVQVTLVWFQEKEIIFIFTGETSATMEPPVLQVSDHADRPSTQPEAVSVLADRLAGGVKAGVAVRPVVPNGLGGGRESVIAQPHSPQLDGVGQAMSNAASLQHNQIILGGGAAQAGVPSQAGAALQDGGAPQTGGAGQGGGAPQDGGEGQGGGAPRAGGAGQAGGAPQAGGAGQDGGAPPAEGAGQGGGAPQAGGALQASGASQAEGAGQAGGPAQAGGAPQVGGAPQGGGPLQGGGAAHALGAPEDAARQSGGVTATAENVRF